MGVGVGAGVGVDGVGVGAGFGWNGWPMPAVVDGHGGGGGEEEMHEISYAFGSRTMSATWLPGSHHPGRTVVNADLGIPTRDFAMDPSQDLMVLFKGGGEDGGLYVYPFLLLLLFLDDVLN